MAVALGRLAMRVPSLGAWKLGGPESGKRSRPARLLGWFWLAVLAGLTGLALTLQLLGAPPVPGTRAPGLAAPTGSTAAVPPDNGQQTIRIPPPIAALQEQIHGQPGLFLPRIAADGRQSMRAYAAPFDTADSRPRIGILLAGMGLNSADSAAALRTLPTGVSFAFSPYAQRTTPLLEAARQRGQEFLISLPLEPAGAPLHDAGNQALLVSASAEQNLRRLEWSLARIGGYVGATGALGALQGERFAAASQPMRDMLQAVAGRGLLYVDPRPGATLPSSIVGRAVDLVIDSQQERMDIERKLRQLEQTARTQGSAMGIAGAPIPVTVGSIANWAAGLAERGFVLAPVSALMPTRPATQTERPH